MDKDDAIIALLTEMRDLQREQAAWTRKAVEESANLQRAAVGRQSIALIGGALVIAGAFVGVWWLLTHFAR